MRIFNSIVKPEFKGNMLPLCEMLNEFIDDNVDRVTEAYGFRLALMGDGDVFAVTRETKRIVDSSGAVVLIIYNGGQTVTVNQERADALYHSGVHGFLRLQAVTMFMTSWLNQAGEWSFYNFGTMPMILNALDIPQPLLANSIILQTSKTELLIKFCKVTTDYGWPVPRFTIQPDGILRLHNNAGGYFADGNTIVIGQIKPTDSSKLKVHLNQCLQSLWKRT